jgi:hypothetical protein
VFEVLCNENEIGDEHASKVELVLYIRCFGDSDGKFCRRVAESHEVDHVRDRVPVSMAIYPWVEESEISTRCRAHFSQWELTDLRRA